MNCKSKNIIICGQVWQDSNKAYFVFKMINEYAIEKFQQFICQGKYGFDLNFVPLMDMNLPLHKFKFTMNTTYKGYAYSKSRLSYFFPIHLKAYTFLNYNNFIMNWTPILKRTLAIVAQDVCPANHAPSKLPHLYNSLPW
jgi:hypothetical protein